MSADDAGPAELGGAVGGVATRDIPVIVGNLLASRERELEVWIRPERFSTAYTVEWTTLQYDDAEQDWRPHHDHRGDASTRQSLRFRVQEFVRRWLDSMLKAKASADYDSPHE